jgi:arginine/lysine/ornithine decarboxylase
MSESEFLVNQKKINGRLCQVDWRLIRALEEVAAALGSLNANAATVAELVRLTEEANKISATVAIPDPPGCDPVDRTSGLGGS